MSLAPVRPSASRVCQEVLARRTQQAGPITAAVQSAPFSSTSTLEGRKNRGPNVDKRISMFVSESVLLNASIARGRWQYSKMLDSASHERYKKVS
jgi:hypothetical protein